MLLLFVSVETTSHGWIWPFQSIILTGLDMLTTIIFNFVKLFSLSLSLSLSFSHVMFEFQEKNFKMPRCLPRRCQC